MTFFHNSETSIKKYGPYTIYSITHSRVLNGNGIKVTYHTVYCIIYIAFNVTFLHPKTLLLQRFFYIVLKTLFPLISIIPNLTLFPLKKGAHHWTWSYFQHLTLIVSSVSPPPSGLFVRRANAEVFTCRTI